MSVAMRVAFPLVGLLVGAGIANCPKNDPEVNDNGDFCGFVPGFIGMGLGMVAATVVDASIAWDSPAPAPPDVRPPHESPRSHSGIAWTVAGVVPTTNGARLVFGGRF